MSAKRGDIILVPFPFTDLSSSKVRPAIIVSSDPQADDIIIAFISSVTPKSIKDTDLLFPSSHPDFPFTGLKKDSVFKMGKLLTIHSSLILRRLGYAAPSAQKALDKLLKKALGLS